MNSKELELIQNKISEVRSATTEEERYRKLVSLKFMISHLSELDLELIKSEVVPEFESEVEYRAGIKAAQEILSKDSNEGGIGWHQGGKAGSRSGSQDMQGDQGGTTPEISLDVLSLPVSHLPYFDDYRTSTGLVGNEYLPLLKSQYYTLVSTKLAKQTIQFGRLKTDCRIHTILPMSTGSGKYPIKTSNMEILETIGKTCEEPTSLHPEQLIGKVIINQKQGDRQFEQVPGYFSLDYLVFDEALAFMMSEELSYQERRKYLRQALDRYPSNKITKRSVDVPFDHKLKFSPHFCSTILLQPLSLPEARVYEGDLRRAIIVYVDFLDIDQSAALEERIIPEREEDSTNALQSFSKFLSGLPTVDRFIFTIEARKKLVELGNLLIEYGNQYSEKVANYVQGKKFTIQEFLTKISAIQAYIGQKKQDITVTDDNVELAFIDLFEFMTLEFHFIQTHVTGLLDYGKGWLGAIGEDQKCLQWLYHKGATSLETSSVSIDDYISLIEVTCHLKKESGRKRYYGYIRRGWVQSKQTSQHETKVWLAFIPKFKRILSRDKVTEVYSVYSQILKKHNLSGDIPPWPPSESPVSADFRDDLANTTLYHPEDAVEQEVEEIII